MSFMFPSLPSFMLCVPLLSHPYVWVWLHTLSSASPRHPLNEESALVDSLRLWPIVGEQLSLLQRPEGQKNQLHVHP